MTSGEVDDMHSFQDATISRDQCLVQFGPAERHNPIKVTRNVILENAEFINCEFIGEGLTTYGAPQHRSTARNIRLKNCRVNSFVGHGAVFDEVLIDGLRTSVMPVILFGCAFRHVTLRGVIGQILINRNVSHDEPSRNNVFYDANTKFYKSVDWALDISESKASCLEIRGSIPVDLIRRNPAQHFIMSREVALDRKWENYEPHPAFSISVSNFLASEAEKTVFVAAPRSKRYKEDLQFYGRLRDAGLVS